ncbi:MAG: LTA synthase family protein [Bdellovibrionales bacterium]
MTKLIVKNLLLLSLLVFISALLRFTFYFSLSEQFSAVDLSTVLTSFVHGMRFDVSAILYVNALFFLFICVERVRISRITAVVFAFLNSFYVALNLSDIDFYLAYGEKVDINFFTTVRGTKGGVLFSLLYVYGDVILALCFSFVLFYLFQRFIFSKHRADFSPSKYATYLFLVLALSFLGIRGGLQKRVLGKQHAMLYADGNAAIAHMTSNTVHNLIRGKKSHDFPEEFKTQALVRNEFDNLGYQGLKLNKAPKNVLFVFIESLSTYSIEEENFFNFRKDFDEKEYVFTDSIYANGNLSLDAITAVFFGVPSYFNLHLFNSKYVQNKWIGMSTVLKEEGFSRFFIHGATRGTQFFDVITAASGIEDFHSIKDDYDAPEEMLATWGVHDEFLYEKSREIISKYKGPFVGSLFTTSSHTPFKGTPNNINGLGDSEKDYLSSITYAKGALESFFESVKEEDWFEETLFIVTGDHSPPILTDWNMSLKYASRLPLLLYFPGSNIGELTYRKQSQHIDLPLTAFQLLGVKPQKWSPFGKSIFDNRGEENLFFTGSKSINFITPSGVMRKPLGKGEIETIYLFKSEDKLKANSFKSALGASEETIKEYVYRLEANELYTN